MNHESQLKDTEFGEKLSEERKSQRYLIENDMYNEKYVDFNWFENKVNEEWDKVKGSSATEKEAAFGAILKELREKCDKKAQEFLENNKDLYYLLYDSNGDLNHGSIWIRSIKPELTFPDENIEGYNPFRTGTFVIDPTANRLHDYPKIKHICKDSEMSVILSIPQEDVKNISDPTAENKNIIRIYLMLAHLGMVLVF